MCAFRNPIWGLFRGIILPSSLLKRWSLLLSFLWSGGHYLCQHTSRQSHTRRERNQLGRIYVSRGRGYDSLCNIHVGGVCFAGIRWLIFLLEGGRKWTFGFRDIRIHFWHGHGDCIFIGHARVNPLISFLYTHTCPLARKGKSFWYICKYTPFGPCWERCSTGFWTLLNRRYV